MYACNVFTAGIAYLHLHMATALKEESPYGVTKHLERASAILEELCKHLSGRRVTFLCGAAGPLALNAVVQHRLGQVDRSKKMITKLKELFVNVKADPSMPSELLYGHVGYLYALLFVNKFIPGSVEESIISEVRLAYIYNIYNINQCLYTLVCCYVRQKAACISA